MIRLRLAIVVALVALTACPRGNNPASSSPTRSPGRPPSAEILAQNVRLLQGAEQAVRLGFQAFDPAARIIITFPDSGSLVSVCPLATIDDPVPAPSSPGCASEIPSGVREQVVRGGGLGAVAVWVRSGDPVIANIRLEFSEGGRRMRARLPVIDAPVDPSRCADNACNPFFELRPVRGGRFSATASWSGGPARFALLEGSVLARSLTATGVPYRVPDEDEGAPPAAIETRMSAPAEYAIVLQHTEGRTPLTGVTIDAGWP